MFIKKLVSALVYHMCNLFHICHNVLQPATQGAAAGEEKSGRRSLRGALFEAMMFD